ncbi:MAG: hypothetical protein C5B54_06455 [Acidobacteria bacterium]|nr:MAG: hypothetical protein C5B54_06455 [Acidobacteriota bacterium]
MEEGQENFLQLRDDYIKRSLANFEDIAALLHSMQEEPDGEPVLQQLRGLFHEISTSARTYGFPQATVLSLQAEYDCDALLRQKSPASPADIDKWTLLLHALQVEFSKGPKTKSDKELRKVFEILIVDDDQQSSGLLTELLQKLEMIVKTAQTKDEAMRILQEGMVDGVITDILLQDGVGYELVEYIRGLPEGDKPVILIASILSGFLDKVEAIRSGADGYFEKPVDWEALLERLNLLLERKKTEQVRILSVEDDPSQALYIDTVLSLAGYQVRVVDEPKDFEENLTAFRPDLVLIDYHFPRFSGLEVARYLRQDDRFVFMPVLLMTEGELETPHDHRRIAGDAYLRKPVAPGMLLTTVAAHVERARFLRSHLNRDGLTRLLTHTAFIEQANAMIAKKRRKPEIPCAFVMIDLDHFKNINNQYGHPTGDRVLVSLSAFLRRRIRQSDIKARYGGEEFAIIIDDIREEEALRLISRLLEEFSNIEHHAADSSAFHISFSAGIAMLDARTMDFELWKDTAKEALQRAKAAGRRSVLTA